MTIAMGSDHDEELIQKLADDAYGSNIGCHFNSEEKQQYMQELRNALQILKLE